MLVKIVFTICVLLYTALISHALEYTKQEWQLSLSGENTMLLRIFSSLDEPGRVTLHTDGRPVFESPFNRGQLFGVCLDKGTRSPGFIMKEVMEGVGVEQTYVLNNVMGWQLIPITGGEGLSDVDMIEGCYSAKSDWSVNNVPISCECDFTGVINQQLVAEQWAEVLGAHQTGLYTSKLTNKLIPKELEDSAKVEQLLAQARADKLMIFDEQIMNRKWLILEYKNGVYDSFSLGLVKQDTKWRIWYHVLGNSKSFNGIKDLERLSENRLAATLCVEDCGWWGRSASVEINLNSLDFKVRELD